MWLLKDMSERDEAATALRLGYFEKTRTWAAKKGFLSGPAKYDEKA